MPFVKAAYSFLLFIIVMMQFFSCVSPQTKEEPKPEVKINLKPPSSYADTVFIDDVSAVFYLPDSLQLIKMKAATSKNIFDGSMHEYFYQQKNAHQFFKKEWPHVKIVDAKNIRWLAFVKNDKSRILIDLDTVSDAYGLFVFDAKKSPLQIDMMNIESQVPDYFKKN